MRRLVTGVDADGRSCVVEDGELSITAVTPGIAVGGIYETSGPTPPARPASERELLPMGLEPGRLRWQVMEWGPEATVEVPMHHTDTVDLHIVMSGSIDLILDDGAHTISAGDLVVCGGVDHSWVIGPQGCVLNSFVVGTPPLA